MLNENILEINLKKYFFYNLKSMNNYFVTKTA